MSTGTRIRSLLGALVAALGAIASPAAGGTYPVTACNDAGNGSTHAWSTARTSSSQQLDVGTRCPSGSPDPYGTLVNGLAVGDVVNAWDDAPPDGSYAEWRFTAPAGTTIAAASVSRDIGNRD